MALTIDTLGKRYGMLPSEIMSRASTFDIFIMDAAITYENHKNEQAMAKHNPESISTENKPVTDESVLAAFEQFKKGKA